MKRFLIMLLVFAVAVSACGCIKITVNRPAETETPNIYTGEGMEFNYIKLTESGSMAQVTVYYAEKTDSGVHLEYYQSWGYWDDKKGEYTDVKDMVHEIYGGEDLYRKVAQLAASAKMPEWDGFSGSDPNVLDGYGFTLEAELADGRIIYASGSNKFPAGYGLYANEIDFICSREEVGSTDFQLKNVQLTLPESWIREVSIGYRPGYAAFEMPVNGESKPILILYIESYAYDGEDYIQLGTYEGDYGTMYVSVRKYDQTGNFYDEMTPAQKEIWDALDDDMQKIVESAVF